MSSNALFHLAQPAMHYGAMIFLIMLLSRFIMLPLAIALHEFGHLVVAKIERIPVLKYQIGSGREILGFRCFGLDWSFYSNLRSGGAVHIPRLIPTTDRHWRSIVRATLAGPAANMLFLAAFACLGLLAHSFIVQTLLFSLAYANWMLVGSARNDWLMAKTARSKDLKAMDTFYVDGIEEYRMH